MTPSFFWQTVTKPAEMIGWIENLLKLVPAFFTAKNSIQSETNKEPVRRFIELFEGHGVARTQIPGFLEGYDIEISLSDLVDDDALLRRIDGSLLNKTCEIFGVRREWLDGVDLQIYSYHDFYKHPEQFDEFIKRLKDNNSDAQFDGVLLVSEVPCNHDQALIILQEMIGSIGDKPIYRYYLCNNWYYSYWKSRAYLTACIAVAWKQHIHIQGRYLSQKNIEPLADGSILLGWQGEGIWQFGGKHWYPEDMALLPDVFLKDIDPERDAFGIKSALKLWLDLERKGLMNTGLGKDARAGYAHWYRTNTMSSIRLVEIIQIVM